jgi:hypothetical protein
VATGPAGGIHRSRRRSTGRVVALAAVADRPPMDLTLGHGVHRHGVEQQYVSAPPPS